jgi:toxin ParE1/3/4
MSARRSSLRLTREADRDLLDILLYTRRSWGQAQEATYRSAITQVLRTLRTFPESGQPRDDLFLGCRSIQARQHVIYYHQADATTIVVQRILHSRQDASAAIDELVPPD